LDVLRWVPFSNDLNQYLLTVRSLPPGTYEIEADGRSLGTFSDRVLSAGLNISAATGDAWQPGGPWDAQSTFGRSRRLR
jgi:hypothetical protein